MELTAIYISKGLNTIGTYPMKTQSKTNIFNDFLDIDT